MNKIDHISNLPNPILHHILTFLSTKEAVRTCVLCKRWVNLWVFLPSLVLDSKGTESNFEKFVDCVFRRRESLHLDSFKISYNGDPKILKKWLLHALKFQPKSLSVVSTILPLALPGAVFRCESLEELVLDMPYLEFESMPSLRPRLISLSHLRRLKIDAVVRLGNDFMDRLMFGCPLLEELSIAGCELESLMISSDVLKHLYIGSCGHQEKICIHTPNLLSLELHGALLGGYTFINMTSLVKAVIEFGGFLDEHDYLWGDPFDNADVLQALSNVAHLELHGEEVKAFLQKEILNFLNFENLRSLYCWTDDTIYPIAGFLLSTYDLEKLTLYYTKISVPPTVQAFLLLLMHNKLLTQQQLLKRQIPML
ncbi:F-box family protein [Rhynchospora pubera]|uniref:F-box family protein n=1 Tax=Rhynchospora pubera TaxID=906938 RepID=A0AAV8F9E7_9POAL|nr:F-box family protein [Rhynchospora pubera]